MNESTSNYDFTTMLEEAQLKLERQYASMKTLREYGGLILGSSSIIISLFSLFKISTVKIRPEFILYYVLLIGIMALLYCVLMYYSIKAVLPYPLEHAIDPTWETYTKAFHEEADRTILERRVYGYLTAIKNNENTIINQYKITKKLNWCMTIVVVMIIAIAFAISFMQV